MSKKKRTTKKGSHKSTRRSRISNYFKKKFTNIKIRISNFLKRRPHRSFRKTLKRDYNRPTKLPGYVSFTKEVFRTIFKNKKIFIGLLIVMVIADIVLVGLMSEDTYSSLSNTLTETGESVVEDGIGAIGKAGLLLVSTAATGGLNQSPSESQQIFSVLIFIIIWLVVVWILRNQIANNKFRLRDALYNSCGPLVSTVVVVLIAFMQLMPVALAVIGFNAATSTGFLDTPFYAIIFWIVAGSLGLLSLYLITSTVIALIVSTIPGMYPFQAIRTAGDLVISRRLMVLKRLVWSLLVLVVFWIIIMIPIILLNEWLKVAFDILEGLPIVPFFLLVTSCASVIFFASYVYLFYRKLIDDETPPAR